MQACKLCQKEAELTQLGVCAECLAKAQKRFMAGDFVSSVTKAFGIQECGGCFSRRKAMNAVDFSQPVTAVIAGLAKAIANPEKELENENSKKDVSGEKG